MAIDGVLLDLDGTLVDTNIAHARAWQMAMAEHGYRVGEDRILDEIGKAGCHLVPALLGRSADSSYGQAMRDLQDRLYVERIRSDGASVFPGVRELFEMLRSRGLRTAVATSSRRESLEALMEAASLDLNRLADAVISDDDVENGKPHPDPVLAAAAKLGLSPAQCVMVGDTPYDVESSVRAGSVSLGVLTGAHDAEALRRSGARRAFRDVMQLLERLDEALHVSSPGSVHLTAAAMESLMEEALTEAHRGRDEGNLPVGCVLADGDGRIVARGRSRTERSGNFLAHAEMVAFEMVSGTVDLSRRELILVSTLEPCVMCFGAAMDARVDTILFGLAVPSNSGAGRCLPMRGPGMIMPRYVGGVLTAKSRKLFDQWRETHPETPFVEDLLASKWSSRPDL